MRVRQIEVFHAIYVSGSISAAARSLNVSHPAVSKVLRHTEDQIGFKLFALSRGRLVATDEAHALFREVRETFEQLRSLEQVVKNIKANGGGHLRLGVVPSLGLSTAPRAISRFRELHPDVTFDVRTLHHDDLFQTLYERECDLAIVYSPPDHPRLKQVPITRAELALLYRGEELDISEQRFPLQRLEGHNVIGLAGAGPLGELLEAELDRQNITIREVISAQTFYIAAALIRHGAGVTIVDEFTARAGMAPGMHYRLLVPPVRFDVAGVFLEDRPLSVIAQKFITVFKEAVAQDRSLIPVG